MVLVLVELKARFASYMRGYCYYPVCMQQCLTVLEVYRPCSRLHHLFSGVAAVCTCHWHCLWQWFAAYQNVMEDVRI